MSLPIYQRVAVTDAGDVIPGAEYTVINENTGVAQPIYSDRNGTSLKSAPYFADSVGTIQFYIAQGTTFRVAASGGVGTYTDRYIYAAHPQSSATDTTTGALMAVGAFGLGTNEAANIADADSLTASGMYRVGGAWVGSPYAGTSNSNQGYLTHKPWFGSSYFLQEFTNLNGTVFTSKWRRKDAGVWSAWNEVITANAAGNVGIFVTPSAWGPVHRAIEIGNTGNALFSATGAGATTLLTNNAYFNGSVWKYARTNEASHTEQANGTFVWKSAASGAADTAIAWSERMRIDSAGNLLVGTNTSYSNNYRMSLLCGSSGGMIVRMSGTSTAAAVFQNSSAASVGTITVSGSTTAYNTSSDYRLKEDDVPMTGATERVKALRPVNFAWKADGSRVDGFFAHELAEVVPEAATGTKDAMMDEEYEVTPAVYEDVTTPAVEAVLDENGVVITEAVEESTESVLVTEAVMGTRSVPDYQGIDQSKLVPLLTATIQDLIARIEALEAGA